MHQGRYTQSQAQQKHSYSDCLPAFQQHRLMITKIRFDGEWLTTKYLMDGAEFSGVPEPIPAKGTGYPATGYPATGYPATGYPAT